MNRSHITAGVFALALAASASAQELTTNGDFETGDLTGWTPILTGTQTFNTTNDAANGAFAGVITNNDPGTGAVVKQFEIGIGKVDPGDTIEISFKAKGRFAAGGLFIAEFFSEIDPEGTSASEILGGGPLLTTTVNEYQMFSFTTVAGPDVSDGVTLQFVAVTGGDSGSSSTVYIDDVSVLPSPGAAGLLAIAGMTSLRRRRR